MRHYDDDINILTQRNGNIRFFLDCLKKGTVGMGSESDLMGFEWMVVLWNEEEWGQEEDGLRLRVGMV